MWGRPQNPSLASDTGGDSSVLDANYPPPPPTNCWPEAPRGGGEGEGGIGGRFREWRRGAPGGSVGGGFQVGQFLGWWWGGV